MKTETQTALEAAGHSALIAWGADKQIVKCCEEMAELTQVLCKRLNGNPHVTKEQIVDEVADVLVMANQMRLLFGEGAVDERIQYKLNRVITKIDQQRKEGKIK